MVAIGRTAGRDGFLAEPYGAVGPFSLDELETQGRITFGECLVMSRQRWQEDQVHLRMEAREKRQTYLMRAPFEDDETGHRETLKLPVEGLLEASQINAAFRRPATTAPTEIEHASGWARVCQ